tara:strand:+ start:2262 stop:2549 length:288 start_codon:yes stop_codon:yes gene_type:complete
MIVEDFYWRACEKLNLTGWKVTNDVINLENTDGSVTEKKIKDTAQELFQEWLNLQYQRDRALAFDPIPEQLDQIYHDIDGWKAKIKAVKDKYPKP